MRSAFSSIVGSEPRRHDPGPTPSRGRGAASSIRFRRTWSSETGLRKEWATRLAIARRIAGWLDISTPLQDNISAAEAVMIVDVIGTTDPWENVQRAIKE